MLITEEFLRDNKACYYYPVAANPANVGGIWEANIKDLDAWVSRHRQEAEKEARQ